MSLLYMRRGLSPTTKKPPPGEIKKARWPSESVGEKPVQREISKTQHTYPERRARVSSDTYVPPRPERADRFGEKPRKIPYRRDYAGGRSLKDILSEAANILRENRIIVVPYVIPLILGYIGVFVGAGQFVSIENLQSVHNSEFLFILAYVFSDFMSVIGMLYWIFNVITAAIAIEITYLAIQGKRVTLSRAWNEIGTERLILLLIADIILTIIFRIIELIEIPGSFILTFIFIFVGELILGMFFIFIAQGIIIDYLGIGATFYNSFKVAKRNFFSILILVLFFTFVTDAVDVPVIRNILEISVALYSIVAFTILYLDRT